MGIGDPVSLRALPRTFVEGVPDPAPDRLAVPDAELHKLRRVLRLGTGDEFALLPGDGRLLRCSLDGLEARVLETAWPKTESPRRLTIALALCKPEAIESAVRMGTEIGVAGFVLFPSSRSVVRWTGGRQEEKVERLRRIAREASEVAYRTVVPDITTVESLQSVTDSVTAWWALSELEGAPVGLPDLGETATLIVGPEGGWAPHEAELLAERSFSLGPRVLRVATAVAAAATLALA